jgi:hypothetical protein
MGMAITEKHQQFATLENAAYDEVGTRGQRPEEIDRGNRHYFGTLIVPNVNPSLDQPYKFDCKVVLGVPRSSEQSPPVITLLRKDSNRGDMTVTSHIDRMLKRGQITTHDLITVFHPAYLEGKIQSSNDCEDIFRSQIENLVINQVNVDSVSQEIIKNPESVVKTILESEIEGVQLRAPAKFQKLSIPHVRYEYVMADAYIEDVRIENDMIQFKCVDSSGAMRNLHSFKLSPRKHLSALHNYAFDYLKSRQEQRALIAICNSDPCRGFFAESVTAISLQLMKSDAGKELAVQHDNLTEELTK